MQSRAAALLIPAITCLLLFVLACGGDEKNPFSVKSEVVTEADRAISLAFASDGRLFYAEQLTGNIRVISADGKLQAEPFAHVNSHQAGTLIEWGFMALALDPKFDENGYVYVYFTELVNLGPPEEVKPVVARLKQGSDPQILIDDLPATSSFANPTGSINFGPDGFLYVSVGDYDKPELAGNLSVPQGKLLRVNKETGKAASDNPFVGEPSADPRIFAYGFREDFDFVFHPESGQIYGTDQTPVSCSELNIITKGANYGWPYGQFPWSDCLAGQQTPAIHFFATEGKKPEDFLSFVTPRGLSFVSGEVYPLVGDALLVCEGVTKSLRRLSFTGAKADQVSADDPVVKDCEFDVAVSRDGVAYYSNDKEIRRLVQEPINTGQSQ